MSKNVAIVLAAGQGKRMNSTVQKQYLLIEGKPVLYYALDTFEKSPLISEIILVTGQEETDYCRKEIVERYHFTKVSKIVVGGKERYHSVFHGLQAVTDAGHVLIHDGARPFVTEEILMRACEGAKETGACVVGMPVKDTIKIVDENGFAADTPDRKLLWAVQTPQVFSYGLIFDAYRRMMEHENTGVTDDASVVETMTDTKVKLVEGSYYNIKITTPEDLKIAAVFCGCVRPNTQV